jgi:ABC-type sugar transport system substrate-binding protein
MNHPLRVPFYEQISDGGRSAAKDCGAPELQVIGPSDFNLEATVQAVRDAISSGVQAIALNTYPPDLWVPVVEESLKKGTSFVGFNAGPVLLGSADSPLYVGPRESEFGRGLGTALADALGPDAKGDVIVGICSPGFSPLLDRVKGMTDLLAARSPGVTLSKPYDTTADQTKSFTTWSDLIQANPDALAFVGVCATDLPNLVKIKQADPNAKYLILGADLDLEALPALEDGTALAMIGQSPYMQGYIPVRMLIESIAMGKKIPSGWIDSGIEIVTKENAAAVREREGSLAATIAFYAPKVEEIFANPSAFVRPYEDLKK